MASSSGGIIIFFPLPRTMECRPIHISQFAGHLNQGIKEAVPIEKAWAAIMVRNLVPPIIALGFFVVTASFAPAGERLGDYALRDLLQTVQARKALADDPALATLNVGVEVRGGIAILWGPIPSVELAFRAEARLRSLIQLIDVRNRLEIGDESWRPAPGQNDPPRVLPDRLPPVLPDLPRTPLTNPFRGRTLVMAK